MLGRIAEDLHNCQSDSAFFRDYRRAVEAADRDNALVQARNWVQSKAGPNLADNALQSMFRKPLGEAETFVRSDNLLKSQWADLVRIFDERIKDHAPFSGDLESEPISVEDLTAMFGGGTGALARVREAAEGAELPPAAESWLREAEILSRIFFEEAGDELRKTRVRVTLLPFTYEPEGFEKNNRVQEVRIYFGESAEFRWEKDDRAGCGRRRVRAALRTGDPAQEGAGGPRGAAAQDRQRRRGTTVAPAAYRAATPAE
jgi:hypothetical protein